MLDFLKRGKINSEKKDNGKINVIIISAACCVPGMDAFDKQARLIIDRAISETGVNAKVTLVPAPTAMVAFRKVINELMAMYSEGKIGVPAILIDNEVFSYGVPRLEDIKAELGKIAKKNKANKI